jgi:transposase
MPGKSKLTADDEKRAALRSLSKSEQRGEADRAQAILLTLEGRHAGEIAEALGVHVSTVRNWRDYFAHGRVVALRHRKAPGRWTEIGPRAGAPAETILNEDTSHDGGWTLPRLCAGIIRRGGAAISPAWLSHQLRQRGLPGPTGVTRGRQDRAAVAASCRPLADMKTRTAAGAVDLGSSTIRRRSRTPRARVMPDYGEEVVGRRVLTGFQRPRSCPGR